MNSTNPRRDAARGRLLVVGAAATLCAARCATVNPTVDYQSASRLIAERTGSADVYSPEEEAAVEQRVAELLDGGLTLDEAVRVALLNNPGFHALVLEIGAARADVAQSALLTNPTISLGVQFPEGGGLADFTFGFAQQIADVWQIPARKRVAEAELEKTILTAGRRAVELAAEARIKCYRLLALQRAIETTEENTRLAERAVGLADAQLRAGEVSEFDVNLARGGLLDVQEEMIATRGGVAQAEADVVEVLGLGRRRADVRLVDALPTGPTALPDEADMLAAALDQRFDARVAEAEMRRTEGALALELRRFFPDVQLGFAFERPERRSQPDRNILADTARASIANGALTAPDIQSRGQRSREKSQIIDTKMGPTLAFALPLFDQNQAQIAKARVRVVQARQSYEQVAESIAAEVQRASAAARTAAEMLRFQQEQGLPQAEATVAGAEGRYRAGEAGVLALLEAQDSLIKRRRSLTGALRDSAIAFAQLEAATGGRLPPPAATEPPAPDADADAKLNKE